MIKQKIIKLIKFTFNALGLEIKKKSKIENIKELYNDESQVLKKLIDVDALAIMSTSIPGMITQESGKFLFMLCYMQEINGDVVEIGSWQGRSTSFLARAVMESGNGKLYAIDNFKGNKGKEEHYMVNGRLDTLKNNFIKNIERIGLEKSVHLLDMKSDAASKYLKNKKIRFLFIDGDHSENGVRNDINNYFPMLAKGSIVVFDDYFDGFPGVITAIDEILLKYHFAKHFYYRHTLVLML